MATRCAPESGASTSLALAAALVCVAMPALGASKSAEQCLAFAKLAAPGKFASAHGAKP